MAVTGSAEGAVPDPGRASWWFAIARRSSLGAGVLFYLSLALLLTAWLGIGRHARSGLLTTGRAWTVLTLWALPLALGPPLFSRDLYSYVSQGVIAHAGLNPYAVGPSVLGPGPLLGSVAAAWRHTPAPYGPLFVTASRWLAAAFGTSLTSEILAQRALELAAMALMTWSLPRLARNLGADPGRALWLGVLSPLALFSFVASGHNDGLMLGLLVTGLALVTEQRLVGGLVAVRSWRPPSNCRRFWPSCSSPSQSSGTEAAGIGCPGGQGGPRFPGGGYRRDVGLRSGMALAESQFSTVTGRITRSAHPERGHRDISASTFSIS